MFDEQIPTQPQPSKQEPQDIFSEVPSMKNTQTPQVSQQTGDMQSSFHQDTHSGFSPKLILIIVAILAVLVIAAFGIQFALRSQQPAPLASQQPVQQQLPQQQEPSEPQSPPPGLVPDNQPTSIPEPAPIDKLTNPKTSPDGTTLGSEQKSALDTDGDGLPNDEELQLGTDPSKSDTDSDGLADTEEVKNTKTNPLVADTDSDGLDDIKELKEYKSDPLNPDTDGDGYLDGAEVNNGYSPVGAGKLEEPAQQ